MDKTKTKYCKYSYMCDKDINCKEGNLCSFFEHTEDFSSMNEKEKYIETDYFKTIIEQNFN